MVLILFLLPPTQKPTSIKITSHSSLNFLILGLSNSSGLFYYGYFLKLKCINTLLCDSSFHVTLWDGALVGFYGVEIQY